LSKAEEVYSALIGPIERKMMRTVTRILQDPDDAADAFQEALAYIWKNLKQIHRHANPQAYILRICASAALDLLRKRMRIEKRERPIDDSPLHGTEVLVSTKIHERETVRAIQGRIADLPKQQAEAVLLRAFEEQSFESIGRALGCSEATARSNVSKGLARLRTLLSAPEWGKEINQ